MKIRLAGYNIDIDWLKEQSKANNLLLTPETISAAYARISRSPKDVTALRREAWKDVIKARKSNQRIIFAMGHHSVAEHAVFNFDIMKVSRIALEEIEKFRLVSFTEKSQRYVTLKGDFVTPDEIRNEKSRKRFDDLVREQNAFYAKSLSALTKQAGERFPQLREKPSGIHLLEGMAKEDARYILSLATEGQVGMTINARNLEHLFRRFAINSFNEVHEIGKKISSLIEKVAPSLILFPEPSKFETSTPIIMKKELRWPEGIKKMQPVPEIVHVTEGGDDLILASFLSAQHGISFPEAREHMKGLAAKRKKEIFLKLFNNMEFFDAPPREFEMVEVTFQGLISASCFAQLKRHRMASLLAGPYEPEFGVTVPDSIRESGLERKFLRIIGKTDEMFHHLQLTSNPAGFYILTNSHRRPVLMKMNLREIYHFIRLRDDEHAQWDIRQWASALLKKLREKLPFSTLLLCGKSQFSTEYRRLFKISPKFLP